MILRSIWGKAVDIVLWIATLWTTPLKEEEAVHIADDIGQSDPHGGSDNAYGSDRQSRLLFLDMIGHVLEIRLLAMDL